MPASPKSLFPVWIRIVRTPGRLPKEAVQIRTPDDAARFLFPIAEIEEVEAFWVVSLDSMNRVLAVTEVTRGTVESSLVHPRETFRPALAANAVAIIVAHNHPAGNPTPSPEDRAVTKRLVDAGKLLGIPVLDHVILGRDGEFTSFSAYGWLEP